MAWRSCALTGSRVLWHSPTPTALPYESSLAFMTTCEVALPLFCQSVLQQHCCRGLSCAMVLPLHLGRHQRWHGQHNAKIATYSVYLFEEERVRDI